ncbi:hypothetical protein BCS42_05790 [Crenothrix sp. D3]|nr:hypothetical protein BCS42_05790 [Crenothrix sp. D3]
MRVVVLGTRGIPDIQGGVESHCEALYPRLVQLGHEVILMTRTPYVINQQVTEYQGVKLKHVYAPKIKSFEAIFHSVLGVMVVFSLKPDILHIHGIGPALVIPFAHLLGLKKIVVTYHCPNYEHKKWGRLARFMLRLGEKFTVNYAQKIIVISKTLQESLKEKYNCDSIVIYNGVNPVIKADKTDYLQSLSIKPQQYIIGVGRFVEEKGFHDLIAAFASLKNTSYQLVLAGDADHKTDYSEQLIKLAKDNDIILTGFIKGEKLRQIYTHAALFVLPSYHEGLPIVLLEAMSYGLKVLVSNISAHIEVNLPDNCYFDLGNVKKLAENIYKLLMSSELFDYSKLLVQYDWERIAMQTELVYQKTTSDVA